MIYKNISETIPVMVMGNLSVNIKYLWLLIIGHKKTDPWADENLDISLRQAQACVGVKQVNEISILDGGVDSWPINSEILEMRLLILE
jgi:hypothetical protein